MDYGETQRMAALKALQILDTPASPAIDRLVSLAATRLIRQGGGPNVDTPIIAFSADVTPDLPAGLFDGLVAKPLDTTRLTAEMVRTLNMGDSLIHAV